MPTPVWTSFVATPIFGRPAIRFPSSGTIGEIEIPLHITKLTTQDEGSVVTEIAYGPLIDTTSNLGSGGTALSYGNDKLSKIQLEGWVDSPTTIVSNVSQIPNIIIDGYRVTYTEILAAYYEGRTTTNAQGIWTQVLPRWFRDGYGRVYGDKTPNGRNDILRIYDLTLQRIEAVPSRTLYTMTLQI